MTLFRYLNDDAFLIFSRGHRHLYEQALLRVYDRYFAVGAQFPSPQEVVHAVYDLIGEQPALLSDDEGDAEEVLPEIVSSRRRRIKFTASSEAGDKALAMAQRVYNRLIDTGWLEEEEYGIKVTVDMPMGPLLVLQQLARLRSDIGKRFGGVVVLVKTSLEQVHHLGQQPTDKAKSDAAHALDNAVENANDFTKTLRAILSDLKRIRRSLLEATSLRDRFNTYFEQFIGELLLKDFSSILTSNHPYRHRDRILDLARNIYLDEPKLQVVTDGYQLAGIARGEAEARQMALANLHSIDSTFDTIGEMFERILQFRRGLETRLRNTIKYAEQGERGLAYRAENLIKRLETLAAKYPERYDLPLIRTALEKVDSPLGSRRLASPRQPRQPVVAEPLVVRKIDPLHQLRKKLRGEFRDRLFPTPEAIKDYLDRVVPAAGIVEARDLQIETIDDFIAFDAVRRLALAGGVPRPVRLAYRFAMLPDTEPHDCDWLRCSNFRVTRSGESKRHAE